MTKLNGLSRIFAISLLMAGLSLPALAGDNSSQPVAASPQSKSTSAAKDSPRATHMVATDAAVVAPMTAATVTVGYLNLDNPTTQPFKLVGVSSEIAERIELHTHVMMDDDIMRMRKLETISIPAGHRIQLDPSGMHLMVMGLKKPLEEGEKYPLTLHFDHGEPVVIDAKIVSQRNIRKPESAMEGSRGTGLHHHTSQPHHEAHKDHAPAAADVPHPHGAEHENTPQPDADTHSHH